MITVFCIGFIVGVIFNMVANWLHARRMYRQYRDIIEPAVMKIYKKENEDK